MPTHSIDGVLFFTDMLHSELVLNPPFHTAQLCQHLWWVLGDARLASLLQASILIVFLDWDGKLALALHRDGVQSLVLTAVLR